jgi:hypothetical protein
MPRAEGTRCASPAHRPEGPDPTRRAGHPAVGWRRASVYGTLAALLGTACVGQIDQKLQRRGVNGAGGTGPIVANGQGGSPIVSGAGGSGAGTGAGSDTGTGTGTGGASRPGQQARRRRAGVGPGSRVG